MEHHCVLGTAFSWLWLMGLWEQALEFASNRELVDALRAGVITQLGRLAFPLLLTLAGILLYGRYRRIVGMRASVIELLERDGRLVPWCRYSGTVGEFLLPYRPIRRLIMRIERRARKERPRGGVISFELSEWAFIARLLRMKLEPLAPISRGFDWSPVRFLLRFTQDPDLGGELQVVIARATLFESEGVLDRLSARADEYQEALNLLVQEPDSGRGRFVVGSKDMPL